MRPRPLAHTPGSPVLALRGQYFLAFFGLGVYGPYLSLFLRSRGLEGAEIGAIWALLPLGAVVAPPIAGVLADRLGHPKWLVLALTAAAGVMFAALLAVDGVVALAALMLAFSACRTSALPLVESLTFAHLAATGDRAGGPRPAYGGIRLWGSVGFILASLAIGHLVDAFSIRAMVYVFVSATAVQTLLALRLPAEREPRAARSAGPVRDVWTLLHQPDFLAFLLAGFLLRTSHGPLWTFLPVHLHALGLPGAVVGWTFAVGVLAEIVFFAVAHRVLERLGARPTLLLAAAAGAVRWWLYALTGTAWGFLTISLLHALTFGAFHVASLTELDRRTGPAAKSTGQALFSAITYGAGGIAGAALSGVLVEAWGIVGLFRLAAGLAVLSAIGYGLMTAWAAPGR